MSAVGGLKSLAGSSRPSRLAGQGAAGPQAEIIALESCVQLAEFGREGSLLSPIRLNVGSDAL